VSQLPPNSSGADALSIETKASVTRPRFQSKPKSKLQRVPLSVWILVPLALVAVAWYGYQSWAGSRTRLTFVPPPNAAMPPLELQLFPEQLAFNQPSPPPPLATIRLQEGNEIVLDSDLVPGAALVRWSGPGVGTGFANVVRGRECELTLSAPASVKGRVGTAEGFYSMGLRSLGLHAIPGARVVAMGGGEHGVPLCETVTDADGRYELTGFASSLPVLGVRVLAKGYAIGFVSHFVGGEEPLIVPLLATKPIRGRIDVPVGVDHKALRVLAKGLPGVEALVAADGSFELEHVPPSLEPRLLVYGLPLAFTHPLVHASAGQDAVRIGVVPSARLRGRVIERNSHIAMGGAMVWHDCGPAGGATVQTDEGGYFVLDRVPGGDVLLRAQREIKNPEGDFETLSGERRVKVDVGKDQVELIVQID
jgi:hypothetical protein